MALGINRRVWESFDDAERRLIEAAAAQEFATSLAEFYTNNARALRKLRADGRVSIRRFSDDMLAAFAALSRDVLAEVAAKDALARRIHVSFTEFRALCRDWNDVGEGAYPAGQQLL